MSVKRALCMLLAALPVLCFGLAVLLSFRWDAVACGAEAADFTFVIDAGHGGEDGGATGVNGVKEKNLNLKIAGMLAELLRQSGYRVVMTRTEDRMLYRPEEDLPGKRKTYDLKNRLLLAQDQQNAFLVSIHMNSFPEERYSGFQVYYSGNREEGKALAERMQSIVRTHLQLENRRECQEANRSIYILSNAKIPAVLVECGFLSNRTECELLCEEDYQKRLCFLLFCAMIEYTEEIGAQPT